MPLCHTGSFATSAKSPSHEDRQRFPKIEWIDGLKFWQSRDSELCKMILCFLRTQHLHPSNTYNKCAYNILQSSNATLALLFSTISRNSFLSNLFRRTRLPTFSYTRINTPWCLLSTIVLSIKQRILFWCFLSRLCISFCT